MTANAMTAAQWAVAEIEQAARPNRMCHRASPAAENQCAMRDVSAGFDSSGEAVAVEVSAGDGFAVAAAAGSSASRAVSRGSSAPPFSGTATNIGVLTDAPTSDPQIGFGGRDLSILA